MILHCGGGCGYRFGGYGDRLKGILTAKLLHCENLFITAKQYDVVVRVSLAAHADLDSMLFQQRRIFLRSILRAAIGVMH